MSASTAIYMRNEGLCQLESNENQRISATTTAQGRQDWARLQQRAALRFSLEQLSAVVATLAREDQLPKKFDDQIRPSTAVAASVPSLQTGT